MIRVEQREMWTPEGNRGDCMKCCFASVLELDYDDVPHFAAMEDWYGESRRWLAARGWALHGFNVAASHEDLPVAKPSITVDGYWLAGVVSRRIQNPCGVCAPNDRGFMLDGTPCPYCKGWGKTLGSHMIVMLNDEIAWDPHPRRADGHGGFTNGYFFRALDPSVLT